MDYTPQNENLSLGNQLPFSLEAEQTVLGAMLLNPDTLPVVMEYLKADSFYRPQHKELFSIIIRMFSNGKTADLITVINEAVNAGVFETSAMAKTYLKGICESVPATSNIASYCKIVEEKYLLRSLIGVANEIIENAQNGHEEARVILDNAEQKIYDIRQGREISGLTRIDDVILESFERLERISGADKEQYLGSKTGFSQIDNVTGGLNNSDLLILAARPGMGKSAFALNVAVNTCKITKKSVVIFSLEMGKEQLVTRMLSSEALVNNTTLRNGRISSEDWSKLARGAETLSGLPIYLDDTAGVNVPQMKAKLRRVKNLGFVVIDYLQLMEGSKKSQANRVAEVSEITRQLKLMAKELNVPVMTLSQLNRGAEGRTDHRPMLSDLRESGSIEQDADIIMFLYRDGYYNKENADQSLSECIIAKNRHGEVGKINLAWNGEYTLFRSLEGVRHED